MCQVAELRWLVNRLESLKFSSIDTHSVVDAIIIVCQVTVW
jgi:hypothetical protein